jgi:O-antigen ligase
VPGQGFLRGKLAPPVTSHNSILTICAEQGLIGGFLFVGALVALLVHLFRLRARAPAAGLLGRDFLSLLIIAIIGHLISTMGYDIRYFRYPSYVLWMLYALGVRFGEILASEERDAKAPAAGDSLAELPRPAGVLVGAGR